MTSSRRRRPSSSLVIGLALLGALGLVGCGDGGGGSSGPTQQQVIDRSDAICRRTSAQIAALPSPEALTRGTAPTAADLPALATYFEQVARLQRAGLRDLRAIEVPRRDRAAVSAILGTVESAVDALDSAVQAARAGDIATFQTRYNTAVQTSSRAAAAAARYGYRVCGQR